MSTKEKIRDDEEVSLEISSEPAFVCDCGEWARLACSGLPFYKAMEGKRYCVLHYPGKDKSKEFKVALRRKLDAKDFDFRGVWFPDEVGFSGFEFSKAADFRVATFTEAADFGFATFTEAAHFRRATFTEAAHFRRAIFKDYLSFAGDNEGNVFGDSSSLDLQFAKIEKPDRVSFHTVKLRPHWFINIDAREFEFTNVEWMPDGFDIKKELAAIRSKNIQSPHRMLSIACRHLAVNAEEGHRYEEASKFRYMSMDTRRREPGRRLPFLSLHWWYWLASGYGERIRRAFLMLGAVWLLFALLYTQVGFTRPLPKIEGAEAVDLIGEPLRLGRAFTYSLGVMSLQKPDPKPLTDAAHALVTLETILGPVQAALLALAIRRKFMR
ncbi:MAG: pentapeptide repeat-containing protein [Acidobacteriota bacterium]